MTSGATRGPGPARIEVIRPRRGRWVAETFAVLVFATFVGCAWIAPSDYGLGDRVAIVLVGAGVALVLHRLAAVRVIVTDAGLEVVNPLHRRRIPWWQVRGVRLERGDAWLILHLVDDETVQAMGVQGSDGGYADERARRIARHVVAHTQRSGD